MVALALGLMILGSLPAPMGSVWAVLDRLADKARIPRVTAPTGGRRTLAQTRRRTAGVVASIWRPALTLAALVGLILLAAAVLPGRWRDAAQTVVDHRTIATLLVGLVALTGVGLAVRGGHNLRVLSEAPSAEPEVASAWCYRVVSHPAGVTVGWSVLYGLGYLILAAFLLWNPLDWLDYWWGVALLATAAVFAFALLLLVPALMPRHAMAGIERQQLDRARNGRPRPPTPTTRSWPDSSTGARPTASWWNWYPILTANPASPGTAAGDSRNGSEPHRHRPWPRGRRQPEEESDGFPGSGLPPVQQPRTPRG